MEKILYCLWRDPQMPIHAFSERLKGEVADKLLGLGARGLQINIADETVAPAAGLKITNIKPQPEAFIYLWVDTAIKEFREPFQAVVDNAAPRIGGYLVSDSVPIRNRLHPPKLGQRTEGFSQFALIGKTPRLSYEHWLDIWHNSHARIAIETQSTFYYTQNVIIRALTYAPPPWAAIVEEGFPLAAMTSQHAFYDAIGDDEKYKKNLNAMMESCYRFIDYDKIDVVPTSQYIFKMPQE